MEGNQEDKMLKSWAAMLAVSGSIVFSASPATGSETRRGEVQINSGRVFLDGRELLKNLSLVQSDFRFLFFYIPGSGLVTISNRKFEGGERSGFFQADQLEVNFGRHELKINSTSAILGSSKVDAWVSFNPSFSLKSDSVMFGYGDDLDAPKKWQKYVDGNR